MAIRVARDSISQIKGLSDGGAIHASIFPSRGRISMTPAAPRGAAAAQMKGAATAAERGTATGRRGDGIGNVFTLFFSNSAPKLDLRYAGASDRFTISRDGATVTAAPQPDDASAFSDRYVFDLTAARLGVREGSGAAAAPAPAAAHVPHADRGGLVVVGLRTLGAAINGRLFVRADGWPLFDAIERLLSADVAVGGGRALNGAISRWRG